jgi:hypothetical protein
MKKNNAFQKDNLMLIVLTMYVIINVVVNVFLTSDLINTSLLGISLFLLVTQLKKMNIKL